ncbi:MAG: helix-turn-helix transcriptional regulator [Anaerolineae bacterium]|nr:helix-turn-helix transcriptional regulator [Anaerolineae bacterium]
MNQFIPLDEFHEKQYRLLLSRLLQARLDAGLTQMEVAEKLGKPQSFVSRSETGARRIDVIELKAFAQIYDVPIEAFVTGINYQKSN